VEICIAMALVAILSVMVFSFYQLMHGMASDNKASYNYLEDHAALKETLYQWVAEKDTPDSVFSVTEDGVLSVSESEGETPVIVTFENGVLWLGDESISGFDKIGSIVFSTNGSLIKCETISNHPNGKQTECSFVFSLRCSNHTIGGGGAHE
jgi:hypothetical protein